MKRETKYSQNKYLAIQNKQMILNVGAAPTESLSNCNLGFLYNPHSGKYFSKTLLRHY